MSVTGLLLGLVEMIGATAILLLKLFGFTALSYNSWLKTTIRSRHGTTSITDRSSLFSFEIFSFFLFFLTGLLQCVLVISSKHHNKSSFTYPCIVLNTLSSLFAIFAIVVIWLSPRIPTPYMWLQIFFFLMLIISGTATLWTCTWTWTCQEQPELQDQNRRSRSMGSSNIPRHLVGATQPQPSVNLYIEMATEIEQPPPYHTAINTLSQGTKQDLT